MINLAVISAVAARDSVAAQFTAPRRPARRVTRPEGRNA